MGRRCVRTLTCLVFPGLDLVHKTGVSCQDKDVEEITISSHHIYKQKTHDTAGLILMYECEKVSF